MKKKLKHGFTLIELIVVIAIIGILAAVLIPTFSSAIQRSRMSSDQLNVRNFNMALATAVADPPENISEVRAVLEEAGYMLPNTPASKGYRYVWDKGNNTTYLVLEGTAEIVYPEGVTNANTVDLIDFSTFTAVGIQPDITPMEGGKTEYTVETQNEWSWVVETINADSARGENTIISVSGTLDLSSVEVVPITVFKGTLTGGTSGATIEGLTLKSPEAEYTHNNYYKTPIGLISVLDGGSVENLIFTNVDINCPGGEKYNTTAEERTAIVGTVAGVVTGKTTISGVTVESGTIVTQVRAGGIVGTVHAVNVGDSVTIENCVNKADVTSNWTENSYGTVGGIVGYVHSKMQGTLNIRNNQNYGNICGNEAGGIVATTLRTNLESNTNYGNITGYHLAGGIAGSVEGGTLSRNTNEANTTVTLYGDSKTAGDSNNIGGVVGIVRRAEKVAADGNKTQNENVVFSTTAQNINKGAVVLDVSQKYTKTIHVSVGGVLGRSTCGTIQNIKNEGTVTVTEQTSGNAEAERTYSGDVVGKIDTDYIVDGTAITRSSNATLPAIGRIDVITIYFSGTGRATLNALLTGAGRTTYTTTSGNVTTTCYYDAVLKNISDVNLIGKLSMVGNYHSFVYLEKVNLSTLNILGAHNAQEGDPKNGNLGPFATCIAFSNSKITEAKISGNVGTGGNLMLINQDSETKQVIDTMSLDGLIGKDNKAAAFGVYLAKGATVGAYSYAGDKTPPNVNTRTGTLEDSSTNNNALIATGENQAQRYEWDKATKVSFSSTGT